MKTRKGKLKKAIRTIFIWQGMQGGLADYLNDNLMEYPHKYILAVDSLSPFEKQEAGGVYTFFWVVVSNINRAKALINEATMEYLGIHRFYHLLKNQDKLTPEAQQELFFFKNKIKNQGILNSYPSEDFTLFNRYIDIITNTLEKYLAIKKFVLLFLKKLDLEDLFNCDVFALWEKDYISIFSKNEIFVVDNTEFIFSIPSFEELQNSYNFNLFKQLCSLVNLTEIEESKLEGVEKILA